MLGEVIRVEPELIIECRELKTLWTMGDHFQQKPGRFTLAELVAGAAPDVRDYTQGRLLDEAIRKLP